MTSVGSSLPAKVSCPHFLSFSTDVQTGRLRHGIFFGDGVVMLCSHTGRTRRPCAPALAVCVSLAFVLVTAACGGGSSDPFIPDPTPPQDHTKLILRDVEGNPLTVASTEPYSPRQTCGACHNVDQIATGYHFQQGRTDDNNNVICQDDYFADGRDFLKSAGMYGKW